MQNQNRSRIILQDITEENKSEKIESVRKALTERKGMIIRKNKIIDLDYIEKAVRKLSLSLDTPLKTQQGESFMFNAQQELTNRFTKELTDKTKELYKLVIDFLGLPDVRIVAKAMTHKGKVLYNPSTKKPLTKAEWQKFIETIEKFMNRNYTGYGERFILTSEALGRILDRMLKYNSLEAVQNATLNDLKYNKKTFDWISQSVKNMNDTFGNVFNRDTQARIEIAQQSAAQRVVNVTTTERNKIQQIVIDGIKKGESKSKVSQNLFDSFLTMNRDFQRIADTEIQSNTVESYISEEVYNTPEGEKIYFKRFEKIDDNTCSKCEELKGEIVLYSSVPLDSQKIKDEYSARAIWSGCGAENGIPTSTMHPWCRGGWFRYYPDLDAEVNALQSESDNKKEKWDNAVKLAKKEFEEKGIKNPDDKTKDYTKRINELYKTL